MKKRVTGKRKFWLSILLLTIIGLGVGYSYLSQQLTINNTVNYGSMKWNVSFTDVEDVSDEFEGNNPDMLETLNADVIDTNVALSSDKKSISLSFDFGTNTKSKYGAIKAAIKNDSSFDVILEEKKFSSDNNVVFPIFQVEYLDEYDIFWSDQNNFWGELVKVGDVLQAGETKEIVLVYKLKELTEDMLFPDGLTLQYDFNLNWVERVAYE